MNESRDELSHRETDVVTVDQLTQNYLRPERVRIQLDRKVLRGPIDVGCLAYSQRGKNLKSNDPRPDPVAESSLVEHRRELLRCMFYYLSISGSHSSILVSIRYYEMALNWCDDNNRSDAFLDSERAAQAYQGYTQYLNERIAFEEIVPRSAVTMQRAFLKLIELRFPEDEVYIKRMVITIRPGRRDILPPKEDHVLLYFRTCLTVALRISEFLINGEKFPIVINFDGFEVVEFPSIGGTISPLSFGKVSRTYNALERRISTPEEYLAIARSEGIAVRKSDAQTNIASATSILAAGNTDLRCRSRLALASLASRAYASVLMCITGASPSELVQFDHQESMEIEKSLVKKELSAVKFRARGKKTRYAVGRDNGIEVLRDYLKLREWILDGAIFDKLFFVMKKNGSYTDEYDDLSPNFSYKFYKQLSGIYLHPACPNITSRGIRKNKSAFLHAMGMTPSTVADVMGHTVSTNLKDYSQVTVEQQGKEFGIYWRSVQRAAQIVRDRASSGGVAIASGHCSSFDHPSPESVDVSIVPDCESQYGCLYCDSYVCHADEEDIHKLTSLQYVINAVREAAPDLVHAEALFRNLSVRIEFILDALSKSSPSTQKKVEEIKYRTNTLGVLTPFWERRLQRYEKLGVVF